MADRLGQEHLVEERKNESNLRHEPVAHVDLAKVTLRADKFTLSVLQPAASQATASG